MNRYTRVQVDHQPEFDGGYSLVPVDHDPFAEEGGATDGGVERVQADGFPRSDPPQPSAYPARPSQPPSLQLPSTPPQPLRWQTFPATSSQTSAQEGDQGNDASPNQTDGEGPSIQSYRSLSEQRNGTNFDGNVPYATPVGYLKIPMNANLLFGELNKIKESDEANAVTEGERRTVSGNDYVSGVREGSIRHYPDRSMDITNGTVARFHTKMVRRTPLLLQMTILLILTERRGR